MSPPSAPGPARAIILAAGRGRRLRPLTNHTPKPLVEVCGYPLLSYGLGLLRANGIEEVVVNVHHLADRIIENIGDGSRFGLRIRYSLEETLLDSGGGIRQASTLFDPPIDGPLVVLNADVICSAPLARLVDFHRRKDALVSLLLRDDARKQEYGVFGIEADGRIARFLGRGRDAGLPEFMFGSVQVLSPAILERMPPGAFASMGDLWPRLFDEGKPFYGYVYEGPWYTADTVEDLQATRKALRQSGPPAHMAQIPPT